MLSKRHLKATRFFKPYTGKTINLKSTGCGVYIIKKGDRVLYVGMSSKDVSRTLYRHFQTWTDNRSSYTKKNEAYERVTYKGENLNLFLVKVIYCPTPREANILEQLLLKKFRPRDNEMKTYLFDKYEYEGIETKLDHSKFISAADEEAPF